MVVEAFVDGDDLAPAVLEELAHYTKNGGPQLSAIVPRIARHRRPGSILFDWVGESGDYITEPDDHSRQIFVSLRTTRPEDKFVLRTFFESNAEAISRKFDCRFEFVPLEPKHNMNWDLGIVTFTAHFDFWEPLMVSILERLIQIDEGYKVYWPQPIEPHNPMLSMVCVVCEKQVTRLTDVCFCKNKAGKCHHSRCCQTGKQLGPDKGKEKGRFDKDSERTGKEHGHKRTRGTAFPHADE